MSQPKIISEKDQEAIANIFEKFLPDDEKPLEATEIIKHLGDGLSEDAGENPIIEHLSKNAEKSFTREDMKVIAGQFGVDKYKANYEASIQKSPDASMKEPEENNRTFDDEAERIDRAMNGPPQGEVRKLTTSQRINQLGKEEKVVFDNIKGDWLKKNRHRFKDMDEEEISKIADNVVIEALESSIKMSKKKFGEAKNNGNNVNGPSQHPQPHSSQDMGMGGGVAGMPKAVGSGNALMIIARQAFKLAAEGGAALAGGSAGLINGAAKGFMDKSPKAGLSINPENKPLNEEAEIAPNEPISYEDRMVSSSKENLDSSVKDLNEKMSEVKELREKGEWADGSSIHQTGEKLKDIGKNMDEINDLKNVLNNDMKRNGVSKDSRMEGIEALNETKKSLKEAKEELGSSPSESEIKEKAEKIMKSIDRLIKAIKNLFSKKKENDSPELKSDDASQLSL